MPQDNVYLVIKFYPLNQHVDHKEALWYIHDPLHKHLTEGLSSIQPSEM